MKIEVTSLQEHLLISPVRIRRIAKTALKDLPGCYSIVLVDNAQMTEINAQYLGRTGTTDVIAFLFNDAPLTRDDCAGEIIVSAELAVSEATRRGLASEDELALYIVHGSLHLAGYDDATAAQANAMHTREKEILAELGYEAEKLWKPIPNRRSQKRRY